jgi:hypothetical protein
LRNKILRIIRENAVAEELVGVEMAGECSNIFAPNPISYNVPY